MDGNTLIAQYRTGYWVRDEKLLQSGPTVSMNQNFFLVDGKPLPVVGTTYMQGTSTFTYLYKVNAVGIISNTVSIGARRFPPRP